MKKKRTKRRKRIEKGTLTKLYCAKPNYKIIYRQR